MSEDHTQEGTSNSITREQIANYEPYLRMLARVQLRQEYQAKLGTSDVVQQAMLQAVQSFEQFRGQTEPELRGWLRQILSHELAHVHRDMHRDRRDIRRELAIQQNLDDSSHRLDQWLVAEHDSPSHQALGRERAMEICLALERLPDSQRDAIQMRYLEGLAVAEIADRLGRTVPAIAGLLHRGLQTLRSNLNVLDP
jgi:RNA polymerase sigma-70 factor (ECF subfamily)